MEVIVAGLGRTSFIPHLRQSCTIGPENAVNPIIIVSLINYWAYNSLIRLVASIPLSTGIL